MLAQTFCSVFSLSIVLRKNFRMRNFHSWEFYNFSNISSWKRKSKQRPGLRCELALGESWKGGWLVLESLTPQNVSGCSEPLQQKQQLRFPGSFVSLCSVTTRGRKTLLLCCSQAENLLGLEIPRFRKAQEEENPIYLCSEFRKTLHTCVQNSRKPYTPVFRISPCPCSHTWV